MINLDYLNTENDVYEKMIRDRALKVIQRQGFFNKDCTFKHWNGTIRVERGFWIEICRVSVIDMAVGEIIAEFHELTEGLFEYLKEGIVDSFPFEVPNFAGCYEASLSIKNLTLSHELDKINKLVTYIRNRYSEELNSYYYN